MSDAVVSVVRDVNKRYSLRQCSLFRVSYSVAGLALKPPSRSHKSRVAALAALEEDADPESIITNISTQTEASDMADYLVISMWCTSQCHFGDAVFGHSQDVT